MDKTVELYTKALEIITNEQERIAVGKLIGEIIELESNGKSYLQLMQADMQEKAMMEDPIPRKKSVHDLIVEALDAARTEKIFWVVAELAKLLERVSL